MPYISEPNREKLCGARVAIKSSRLDTIGDVEYLFCLIADHYLSLHPFAFATLNSIVGAFECGKMEFYRKMASVYEDGKEKANGTVWTQGAE